MTSAPSKHCLLVVDDEPDLVQSVKDLLRFDYRVLGTTRATEGLRIMEKEEVHIVMTDQRMPEMTGVEFLKFLRDAYPDAIRLLFTAYADIDAVTDAINQGNVYRYISKPWEPHELKSVLRQAVDKYDLQAERKKLLREIQETNRQLESANQELRQANDVKRAFIRVASHELRTPLTIIMGMAEISYKAQDVKPPLKNWLEQIFTGSLRLNERVEQMVKLLLAENFARPLQSRPEALTALLQKSAAAVATFAQQRKQNLVLDIPADLGTLTVEADKIHDSIVQLLINAIKFTPDAGTITLSAHRTPDRGADISVADSGLGIDPQCLPRLFDPFFTRFDVSRHSSGTFEFDRRGLGLGLSVVKAFVEMHGGTIKVQSELKRGTTFTIHLPGDKTDNPPR